MRGLGWNVTLGLLVMVGLSGVGCIRPHGPEDVRRELSYASGVKLHREVGVTVTRSGVWLARKIMKWSGDKDEIPVSLRGLRRVEVGVYEVRGLRNGVEDARPIRLEDHFGPSWTPIVRVQEEGEKVVVLTREGKEEGTIREMMVVVTEDDEWVLVRMSGKLERIVEDAMRFAFQETDRPELYTKSREERGLDPEDPRLAVNSGG